MSPIKWLLGRCHKSKLANIVASFNLEFFEAFKIKSKIDKPAPAPAPAPVILLLQLLRVPGGEGHSRGPRGQVGLPELRGRPLVGSGEWRGEVEGQLNWERANKMEKPCDASFPRSL